MTFYVLLMCDVCCLFQSVFLFFSSRVSGKTRKYFIVFAKSGAFRISYRGIVFIASRPFSF
jgi:hypothetical protein